MSVNEVLLCYSKMIEQRLDEILQSNSDAPEVLNNAMRYSLLAGGKRLRPAIMLEFYKVLGGDPEDILNFACAVEMIHTYSLIHDDLPCMDDDDMRRGKPSCHIAFGEDIALLAGDSLLTLAFETASDVSDSIDPKNALKAINLLGKAAGMCKMAGGQVLDLQSEGKDISLDEINKIHDGKTVAMIKINAQIACVLFGADKVTYDAACDFCESIGLAFQIRDDILDVIGDEKTLGKPIGSDDSNEKNTYVSLLGLDKSVKIVNDLTNKAISNLDVFENSENLRELAQMLAGRNI
ncbi:MAG: polyprenyl synthetase family protein [Clostridia bacterium]|nr:polyprenyl synthetase family protein [Clostridia bacterium]